MIYNLQKKLQIRQSIIFSKGFTPFKTFITPADISFASFKEYTLIIIINGYEILFFLLSSKSEDYSKQDLIIFSKTIDNLIRYMKNFSFVIKYFTKESSFLSIK